MAKRAKVKWDPAEFDEWYKRMPKENRERALADLKPEHRKLYVEWKIFRDFATASGLDIDPRSIEMCDPNDASPPLPDVSCLVSGGPEYFELGEVTEEDLARTASIALKNREDSFGDFVANVQPLVRIFLKKCRKRYTANGRALHLVLYFAVGHQFPFEPQLENDLQRWRDRLINRIQRSRFSTAWLYDDWQERVLVRLDR